MKKIILFLLLTLPLYLSAQQETSCNDGLDNDGDGLIDCFDGDCNGTGSCPNSFPCLPDSELYQVRNDSLIRFDPANSTSFTTIIPGTAFPNGNRNRMNAIGYNVEDGYIYGISVEAGYRNHLFRMDADNGIEDLGPVNGLPANGLPEGPFHTGDFDLSGNLYVTRSDLDVIYMIDVDQLASTIVTSYQMNGLAGCADFSYNPVDGYFYGLTPAGILNRFDVFGGAITPLSPTGYTISSCVGYGASFSDINGNLYFFCNNNGSNQTELIKIEDADLGTPHASSLSVINGTLANNDGAACALSDSLTITEPIPCLDTSVFYQVLYGNEFVEYDPLLLTHHTIYVNPYEINAIGYNTLDNYIYGIKANTNHLVRVGADGVFHDLGAVNNLPVLGNGTLSYFAGDFNANGELLVTRSSISTIYKIDVSASSPTAVPIPIASTPASFPVSDFSFFGGLSYGLDESGSLYSFDENNGFVSNLGALTPAIPCADANGTPKGYGASFADGNGGLYFFCNGSGELFKVNPLLMSSNLLQSTGLVLETNDGAACALSGGLIFPERIPCLDNSVFYQVLYGNEFVEYIPGTSSYSTIHVNPYEINAIGYNILDNYIYGIKANTNHLVKVGADGVFHDLGAVNNLPVLGNGTLSYFAGAFNANGELLVTRSSISTVYKIDVSASSLTAVPIPITSSPASFPVSDFSYSGGLFYGLDESGNLYSFDENNGAVSNMGALTPAIPCADANGAPKGYGASFADGNGGLYFFCNGSGELFKVNPFLMSSGLLQSTGVVLETNDGAACILSDSLVISSAPELMEFGGVHVYPNPTTGHLTIERPGPALGEARFRVIGLWGRTMAEGVLEGGSQHHQLDLSHLPEGIYILEIGNSRQGFFRVRIIKQGL
ncbi:MAG: T9SS type A sorting domain-containing protein [Lewinellaceae bacterium]|nr:T9SS type A sorting domain-containing protein [Lewinellaceae bacterium]